MTSQFNFEGVTVLWDNDATLVDSEIIAMPHAIESVFAPFDELGVGQVISQEQRNQYAISWAGKQISQMFLIVEDMLGTPLTDNQRQFFCDDDAKRVVDALEKVEVLNGIPETLDYLDKAGAEQAVVTSSSLARVVPGLVNNGIAGYFRPQNERDDSPSRIWSATETLEGDPTYGRRIPKSFSSPQIYQFALDAIQPDKKKVVAIEDSPSGAGAAVALGIPVIALTAATHIQDKQAHGQMMVDYVSEKLGRPAIEGKDIIVVHDPRDIPLAIGRILDLPLVVEKVNGVQLRSTRGAANDVPGDR